ncbi:MAG TPA: TetR/AcrR family transcriptional regulator [Myxococcota bacterium]|nr:TetR/AcrR family transcriptional regulator [Myxococcota bacterium]
MSAGAHPPIAPRKRPTQARAQARVERILAAARELVERAPLDAVTTTAIAERASLPVGSLYQYFPNRLAILAAVGRAVLREIDDATIAMLDASADAPWPETIDRVVDGTVASHRGNDRTAALWRSLAATPEFRKLAQESNGRLAAALARQPALAACGRPADELQRIARVAIEAGDTVQKLVLEARSPAEADAMAGEMKKLLRAYLGLYLDGPSGARPPGAHPPEPSKDRT